MGRGDRALSEDGSEDARWLVVDGRRWRREDPALPADVRERLLSHLGRGRSGVRRAKRAGGVEGSEGGSGELAAARRRVDLAKHGLGERGTAWWEQTEAERRARWQDALTALDALD